MTSIYNGKRQQYKTKDGLIEELGCIGLTDNTFCVNFI